MPKATEFHTIALVGRPDLARYRHYFASLVKFMKKNKRELLWGSTLAKILKFKPATPNKIVHSADLIIIFGGDGTYLRWMRQLYGARGVFLGVNLGGTLGFLTEHDSNELQKYLRIFFAGRYKLNERILLDVNVVRKKKSVKKMHALNEVVISQHDLARLISLDLAMDGQRITTYLADGMIVATPTGSTAYSLSAGGPIVYPSLHSFVITPISPHLLANRPIVIPDDREVTADISDEKTGLTVDGQESFPILPGDRLIIRKAVWVPKVIYLRHRNYFEVLRKKLNWGERG